MPEHINLGPKHELSIEQIKKNYNTNLEESLKLSKAYNDLSIGEKSEEFLEKLKSFQRQSYWKKNQLTQEGKMLSKEYSVEINRLAELIENNLRERVKELSLLGIKKLDESAEETPELKEALENYEKMYVMGRVNQANVTKDNFEDKISVPLYDQFVIILKKMGYESIAKNQTVSTENAPYDMVFAISISFEKGDVKYILELRSRLEHDNRSVGGSNRIASLHVFPTTRKGDVTYWNSGVYSLLKACEDENVQRQIDHIIAVFG